MEAIWEVKMEKKRRKKGEDRKGAMTFYEKDASR